ncbi:MAG TPA: hypothetical protein P5137_11290 [Candidatus Brocadiia bacterium]|nr:hypothetical protein [Candidatus Brocadiia bacterium]
MTCYSGPRTLKIAKRQPVLFATPILLRPTSGPAYTRVGGDFAVRYVNVNSGNPAFSMQKPSVIPMRIGHTQEMGWADHFFTVLLDNGLYRMWYEVIPPAYGHDLDSCLCYAESKDGVEWKLPRLRGPASSKNRPKNVVYPPPGRRSHGLTVFKDPSDPRNPYKLIGFGGRTPENPDEQVEGAQSPDGIHWQPIPGALVPRYMSDTQTVARYDPARRKYIGFFRYIYYDRRAIGVSETDDFTSWPRPQPCLVSDSLQEDIYTNGYTVYPRNPDLHFLFPAIYRKNADNFQCAAYASLDARAWHRCGEPFLAPEDITGSPTGLVCPGCGLTPLEGGARIGLPIGHTSCLHNAVKTIAKRRPAGSYHWALWDRDRLAGVSCESPAEFMTISLEAPAGRLALNFRTGMTGEIRVEVLDSAYKPVPGMTLDKCCLLNGDHANKIVRWGGKDRLPASPTVALRFTMRNATLFAFTVV